jgi:NAD-dependent SIR2 family protein deacetylase
MESFIVSKLKGHGKVNVAGDFSIDRCLDCHAEVANHGVKEKVQPVCAKCHEPGKGALKLGPIHKSEVFTKAPLRVAVKLFYGFGLAMIALAFMSMAGKKYAQPKTDEQEAPGH